MRCHSHVHTNAGLCGALVSVGSVGTSYTGGISGTALGTACGAFTPPRVPPEYDFTTMRPGLDNPPSSTYWTAEHSVSQRESLDKETEGRKGICT
jgi:hypothetical protein